MKEHTSKLSFFSTCTLWLWLDLCDSVCCRCQSKTCLFIGLGPASDHCLPLSLTHSLTHSVLFSKLDRCDPGKVKMPTQNLLRLFLLLMLMMRIMLATVCYRFGSWRLVLKLNFCSDFEHKGWSRFWSWSSGKIWSWRWSVICCWCFFRGYEVESWSRFWS